MTARDLSRAAIIAALYALLTILVLPISSGLMQCRVSEALCVLPYFSAAAVPGLFVGCLIANLVMGAPVWDVVLGSLATLLAALLTYKMRSVAPKWLAPLPSVVFNALIVGALLTYVYQVGVPFPVAAGYVALGQTIACFGLGLPLMAVLERFRTRLF